MSDHPRILVVRTDRLGDVILTLPVLSAIRDAFPGAYLGMLLQQYTGAIVVGHPALDATIWYDRDGVLLPVAEIVQSIRSHAFDVAIVVHPTPRLAWVIVRAGIPRRIGTGYRSYSLLFTDRVYDHRKDARFHELEYNLRLLKPLLPAITVENVTPRFDIPVDAAAVRNVDTLLSHGGLLVGEKIVVLHPGSGGSAHDWPPERFGRLALELLKQAGLRVVVTGTQRDHDAVAQVRAATGGRAIILEGVLTMRELAALLSRASVMVANSTGPLHLAAAFGTPVVGLYSQITSMSARRWGPYSSSRRVLEPEMPRDCSQCRNAAGRSCACMESITVEKVAGAVTELLELPSQNGRRRVAHA